MYIRRVDIKNFRGVTEGTFLLSPQTVLVGPNGCGKSTLIDALALVLGRGRLIRSLTEHDFNGSNPKEGDRFRIVVTLCGFAHNDPNRNTNWFRASRAVPKWIDQSGDIHSESSDARDLCAQIAVAGRFDFEELTVETRRYFYDASDPDSDDPFLSESHIDDVPPQLFNEAGFFVLLARRTWEGVVSFNSELFRRTLLEAAKFPAQEVLHQRDALRDPEQPIESSSALGTLVTNINTRLSKLVIGAPELKLRLTTGDSDGILHALQPHYASGETCLPVSRHGVGLLSLQSFLLLLEVAHLRREQGRSVILALEEPELHLAPGLSVRLVAESRKAADQVICTTHSPRVAGSFPSNQVLVMAPKPSSTMATPLLESPLTPEANNTDRKLFIQNRSRLIEALMQPTVLVPEGRFDEEWLTRLARAGEENQKSMPFGSVFGLAPTEDAKVVRTTEVALSVRPRVISLVDGDGPGTEYVTELESLSPAPDAIIQWPKDWTIEDVVCWILAADEVAILETLQLELSSEWSFSTLADLATLLKTKNKGTQRGMKEDVVAHDFIATTIHQSTTCRERCALILDAFVAVATKTPHELVLAPDKGTQLHRFKIV